MRQRRMETVPPNGSERVGQPPGQHLPLAVRDLSEEDLLCGTCDEVLLRFDPNGPWTLEALPARRVVCPCDTHNLIPEDVYPQG